MDDLALDEVRTRLVAAAGTALERETTHRTGAGMASLDRDARVRCVVGAAREELAGIDRERLGRGRPSLDHDLARRLLDTVVGETIGLGPVQALLVDPAVEEILGRWDHLVLHRSGRRPEVVAGVETPWRSEQELIDWLAHVARSHGHTERAFNPGSPLLVLRLGPGLRLAAQREVGSVVSFALRRNALGLVSLDQLVARSMLHPVAADLLAAMMALDEARLVIAGATGAGKTTLARACLDRLGAEAHVIVMEDTAEIDLFDPVRHPNVESWEVREANSEGVGEVSLADLVRHCLRHRPDWAVVGEVRDGSAATPMVAAMSAGVASLTTVHARSAIGAVDKLQLYLGTGPDRLPADVAQLQLAHSVDLVIHVRLDPTTGRRHVSEMVAVDGFDGGRCRTATVYREAGGVVRGVAGFSGEMTDRLRAVGFDTRSLGAGSRGR